jgi:hypothetical protein
LARVSTATSYKQHAYAKTQKKKKKKKKKTKKKKKKKKKKKERKGKRKLKFIVEVIVQKCCSTPRSIMLCVRRTRKKNPNAPQKGKRS